MDSATPRPQSALLSATPRRRGPPTSLCIQTPTQNPDIALVQSETSATASTFSSASSDNDSFILPSPSKPRSLRNMKKLSLTLPSAQSSSNSLTVAVPAESHFAEPKRRPSVISLPNPSTASMLRRKDEDVDDAEPAPYLDGPVQILPGVWLGSEDNVRDWKGLIERGIKSVLNVAKEVSTVFDSAPQPLRPFMSTPDLNTAMNGSESTYYPAHVPSGRPSMHYLKLHWSHGQADLVQQGFPAAMDFVDQARKRGDGVLIHCQCGVSRSATLVIALVMRAAAQRSPNVPSEVWALKGMHGAYAYVKAKSQAAGPNLSLLYQLLDYERALSPGATSPTRSEHSLSEEEWGRQRLMMEDSSAEDDRESIEVMHEARALDQAMQDRMVARKSSASSFGSSNGVGSSWRLRFGARKRTGSIASSGSVLSEDLVEEDEEEELLGVGGGFDGQSVEASCSSAEPTEDESSNKRVFTPPTARHVPAIRMPPSAPAHKPSFSLPPPPATAFRTSFDMTPRPSLPSKSRRRPPPLGLLPPVPSSPVIPLNPSVPSRPRVDARKPELPPAHLRHQKAPFSTRLGSASIVSTPSQTLFVFPPSPTFTTRTPSTMTLTSNSSYPFPPALTPRPRVSTKDGRRRSYIGLPPPATPTTASSRVDARGWVI
ncbi:hypothetical protein B0H21DRAFT_394175 [Amylocystis lapponica]|nr:hypothetical protein B0H21DRAFT_394175 [Amylocystis lapponica]